MEMLGFLGAGIGFLVIVLAVSVLIDAAVLWFIMNYMLSIPEGVVFKKCILSAIGLKVVVLIAVVAMALLPFGLLIGLAILWLGARVVIESFTEILDSSLVIILYILMQFGLGFLLNSLAVQA